MKDIRKKWIERNEFYNFIAYRLWASDDWEEIIDQIYAEVTFYPTKQNEVQK